MDHLPKIEGETPTYHAWPSWATNPATAEQQIFNSEAEVLVGWRHHGEIKKGKAAPPPPAPPLPPPPSAAGTIPPPPPPAGAVPTVDKAGTPLDPARHTGTLTSKGLWRMKVGISRPENEGIILSL